jgi:hypothetical protein
MTKLLLLPALSFWVGLAAGILIGRLSMMPARPATITSERLEEGNAIL